MIHTITLFHLVLAIWSIVSVHAGNNNKAGSAAIPRSKVKKGGALGRVFGHGIMQKMFREMKISFCSELEALTLQLTRPNSNSISMASLDNIVNFVNLEHDNPQLMVSLLVKFSRKLSEPNVYTKLKALLVLHRLMENVKEKARAGLLLSVQSLQSEMDDKVSTTFFSVDAIEEAASLAASVAEIEAVELARVYGRYVFDYLDAKGSKAAAAATAHSIDVDGQAEALLSLLEQSSEVERCCKRAATKLNKQVLDSVKDDRAWTVTELSDLYKFVENNGLRGEVEATLSELDPKFKPINKASRKANPVKSGPVATATPAVGKGAGTGSGGGAELKPSSKAAAVASAATPTVAAGGASEVSGDVAKKVPVDPPKSTSIAAKAAAKAAVAATEVAAVEVAAVEVVMDTGTPKKKSKKTAKKPGSVDKSSVGAKGKASKKSRSAKQ